MNQSAVCLACLFNNEGPQPDTVWMLNGQIVTPLSSIAYAVNSNGTMVIVRQPLSTFILTCQHGRSILNITLKGE